MQSTPHNVTQAKKLASLDQELLTKINGRSFTKLYMGTEQTSAGLRLFASFV